MKARLRCSKCKTLLATAGAGLALFVVAIAPFPHPALQASTASSAAQARIDRGEKFFADKGCSQCHGVGGFGGGRGPDLSDVGARLTQQRIADQITHGSKGMPPFGSILTRDEVADLVAFLRTHRKKVVAPAPASASTGKSSNEPVEAGAPSSPK